MAKPDTQVLSSKIQAAKHHVGAAEAELDKLMREVQVEPRSQKTTISEVMQSAFEKLRAAKASVAELEALLITGDE